MDRPDQPRSTDLFEQIAGYPKPPLIPLPDLAELSNAQPDGTPASRWLHQGLALSGLTRFTRRLYEDDLEALLRSTNLNLPGFFTSGLFSPTLSVTAALQDDPRALSLYQRAATLVFGAYSLYRSVIDGCLEPLPGEQSIGEMGLYPNLFSTNLVVAGGQPALFKSIFEPQITVLARGRFFLIQLGDLRAETWVESLATALESLLTDIEPLTPGVMSPGLLTACDTATQQQVFQNLANDPIDAPIMRRLRRSFLVLCFDLDDSPETPAEAARLAHSANYINRWFHASLQLVIFANASVAAVMSYPAHLDGNIAVRSAAEIQRRAAVYPLENHLINILDNPLTIHELDWDLIPKAVPARLYQQVLDDVERIRNRQPATFELAGLGSEHFKARRIDPAAGVMLALQAAAEKLTGGPLSLSETVDLSRYRCLDQAHTLVSSTAAHQFASYLNQNQGQTIDPAQAFQLAQAALAANASAIDRTHQALPLPLLIQLYLRVIPRGSRWWAHTLLRISLGREGLTGVPDGLASFPVWLPQTPVIGRPGVRLPYLRSFGLYCLTAPDRLILTISSGAAWKIPHHQLIAEMGDNLRRIGEWLEYKGVGR